MKFSNLSNEAASAFVGHLTLEENNEGQEQQVLYVNLLAKKRIDSRSYNGIRINSEYKSGDNAQGLRMESELLDYLKTTYLKPLRNASQELIAGKNSRISQLLASSIKDDSIIQNLIEMVTKSEKDISNDPNIKLIEKSIKQKLFSLIFKEQESNSDFNPVLSIFGYVDFSEMSEPQQKTAFRNIMEKISLELNESRIKNGLGYNNLLFMAAEMLFLDKQDEGFRSLLIEEPEAHLHPQLQLKFIKFIQSLEGIQCFLTTHSPNLASKVPLESLIIMNKGYAFSLRKGCTHLDGSDYVFLEKFLDVTKANMFFARGILMVEGDGENILLPTIAKLLGFPLEDYGISIINGSGLTYKRYAKIYRVKDQNQSLPIQVACITDKDIWPLKADKEQYPNIGFKERKEPNTTTKKGGNLNRWADYDPDKLSAIQTKKQECDGDNVKTFISDYWTFEYCLAYFGLDDELIRAINNQTQIGKEAEEGNDQAEIILDTEILSKDPEERAIQIYKEVETAPSGKTEYNYRLVAILEQHYSNKPNELYKKLPPYIRHALSHV